MPDFDQLDQCVMLGRLLFWMPGPSRAPIAQGLYELGVRVHPELATKDVMVTGPTYMGDHRGNRIVDIKSARDGMSFLQQHAPDWYDKMQAATTEQKKQQLLAEISQRYPGIIADAAQRVAAANPEDFEK